MQALVQRLQTSEYDVQRHADRSKRSEDMLSRVKSENATMRDRERLLSTEITRLKTMLETQRMQVIRQGGRPPLQQPFLQVWCIQRWVGHPDTFYRLLHGHTQDKI